MPRLVLNLSDSSLPDLYKRRINSLPKFFTFFVGDKIAPWSCLADTCSEILVSGSHIFPSLTSYQPSPIPWRWAGNLVIWLKKKTAGFSLGETPQCGYCVNIR